MGYINSTKQILYPVIAICLLIFASCSKSSSSGPAPSTAETDEASFQSQGKDVQVIADRHSGIPGTTFTLTASLISEDPQSVDESVRWQWDFGNGANAEGQHVTVAYQASGVFVVELTATDSAGRQGTSRTALTVFSEEGAAKLPGDVDGDGLVAENDAELILSYIGNIEPLEEESKNAADVNLNGSVDLEDEELVRNAVDEDLISPRALLPNTGTPAEIVTILSPLLLNPNVYAEVTIDSLYTTEVFRYYLGYGTFVIPLDLWGADPTTLPESQEILIELVIDGTVQDVFTFELRALETITAPPGQLIADAIQNAKEVCTVLREDLAIYLQGFDATEEERTLVLGLVDIMESEASDLVQQYEQFMEKMNADSLKLITYIACANGLIETKNSMNNYLSNRSSSGRSASGVADFIFGNDADAIDIICSLKRGCEFMIRLDDILSPLCIGVELWFLREINPKLKATALGLVLKCKTISSLALTAELISALVPNVKKRLELVADPPEIKPGQITEVSIYGRIDMTELCSLSLEKLTDFLAEKIIERYLKKYLPKKVVRILQKSDIEDISWFSQIIDRLKDIYKDSVGSLIEFLEIEEKLKKLSEYICDKVTGLLPDDKKRILLTPNNIFKTPNPSNAGQYEFTEDKTVKYTLDPAYGCSYVKLRAEKEACNETYEGELILGSHQVYLGIVDLDSGEDVVGIHAMVVGTHDPITFENEYEIMYVNEYVVHMLIYNKEVYVPDYENLTLFNHVFGDRSIQLGSSKSRVRVNVDAFDPEFPNCPLTNEIHFLLRGDVSTNATDFSEEVAAFSPEITFQIFGTELHMVSVEIDVELRAEYSAITRFEIRDPDTWSLIDDEEVVVIGQPTTSSVFTTFKKVLTIPPTTNTVLKPLHFTIVPIIGASMSVDVKKMGGSQIEGSIRVQRVDA